MKTTMNIAEMQREIQEHLDADKLIKGAYWKEGKGCFIGCLAHSNDPAILWDRFRLPEPLVRICENIFEAVPKNTGRVFFRDFGQAVGCDGKDLTRVHWAFLAAELRALPPQEPKIQAVIDPVIAGMDLLAAGGVWAIKDARVALAAADAADAAFAAALAAAFAAYASAFAAAEAAADAAEAAAYAAFAAARAAARERQIVTLLRLIEEAPVTEGA